MKSVKNISMLAVIIVLTAIGFSAFAGESSDLVIFELGQGFTLLMAGLFVPFSLYVVAKDLT